MKKLIFTLLTTVSLYAQTNEDFIGEWTAEYKISGVDIYIYVHIYNNKTFTFDKTEIFNNKMYPSEMYGKWYLDNDNKLIAYLDEGGLILKYINAGTLQDMTHGIFFYSNDPQREQRAEIEKKEEKNRKIQEEKDKENKRLSLLNSYIEYAYSYYDNENYLLAIYNFEQAVEVDSDYTIERCRYEIVNSYMKIAENYLEKKDYHNAGIYYLKASNHSIDGKEYDDKLEYCNIKALETYEKEGDTKYILKDYKAAIEQYGISIETKNSDSIRYARVHKKISLCYEKLGDIFDKKEDYTKAVASYKEALKYYPTKRVKDKLNTYNY